LRLNNVPVPTSGFLDALASSTSSYGAF
jgi:hypothetical protein